MANSSLYYMKSALDGHFINETRFQTKKALNMNNVQQPLSRTVYTLKSGKSFASFGNDTNMEYLKSLLDKVFEAKISFCSF